MFLSINGLAPEYKNFCQKAKFSVIDGNFTEHLLRK